MIGPPAPVPPEVALPTAAEVTQMNDALAKFIASDKSATAPLLKRYEHVVLLPPFRVNTAATYTQTVQRMGPRHEGFVERARQGNIDLLLHGDSILEWLRRLGRERDGGEEAGEQGSGGETDLGQGHGDLPDLALRPGRPVVEIS